MNRIREERKRKNLTLQETVDKLKEKESILITSDALSKYERGDREPKLETWQKLADFYGVSVPYLQGYEQPTPHNRLKELRQERGLSQDELAKCLGITRQSISYYENGDRNPSKKIWKSLADFFNVSVPYIQGEIDTQEIVEIAKSLIFISNPKLEFTLANGSVINDNTRTLLITNGLLSVIKKLGADPVKEGNEAFNKIDYLLDDDGEYIDSIKSALGSEIPDDELTNAFVKNYQATKCTN